MKRIIEEEPHLVYIKCFLCTFNSLRTGLKKSIRKEKDYVVLVCQTLSKRGNEQTEGNREKVLIKTPTEANKYKLTIEQNVILMFE